MNKQFHIPNTCIISTDSWKYKEFAEYVSEERWNINGRFEKLITLLE